MLPNPASGLYRSEGWQLGTSEWNPHRSVLLVIEGDKLRRTMEDNNHDNDTDSNISNSCCSLSARCKTGRILRTLCILNQASNHTCLICTGTRLRSTETPGRTCREALAPAGKGAKVIVSTRTPVLTWYGNPFFSHSIGNPVSALFTDAYTEAQGA